MADVNVAEELYKLGVRGGEEKTFDLSKRHQFGVMVSSLVNSPVLDEQLRILAADIGNKTVINGLASSPHLDIEFHEYRGVNVRVAISYSHIKGECVLISVLCVDPHYEAA